MIFLFCFKITENTRKMNFRHSEGMWVLAHFEFETFGDILQFGSKQEDSAFFWKSSISILTFFLNIKCCVRNIFGPILNVRPWLMRVQRKFFIFVPLKNNKHLVKNEVNLIAIAYFLCFPKLTTDRRTHKFFFEKKIATRTLNSTKLSTLSSCQATVDMESLLFVKSKCDSQHA